MAFSVRGFDDSVEGGFELLGCGKGAIGGVGDCEVSCSLEELAECGCSPGVVHLLGLRDGAFEVGGKATDDLEGLPTFDVELSELRGDEDLDEVVLLVGSGD